MWLSDVYETEVRRDVRMIHVDFVEKFESDMVAVLCADRGCYISKNEEDNIQFVHPIPIENGDEYKLKTKRHLKTWEVTPFEVCINIICLSCRLSHRHRILLFYFSISKLTYTYRTALIDVMVNDLSYKYVVAYFCLYLSYFIPIYLFSLLSLESISFE